MYLRQQLLGDVYDSIAKQALLGCGEEIFHVFAQYQKDEKDMTTETFINVVCKGLRILEIWRNLILKRYGSVAQNSPALACVCEHLSTVGGLQSIMACAAAGLNLHGKSETQQGIAEWFLLVQELDKCKAGGLPPPISIPDEVELHRRAEAAKAAAAAEELRKAEEAKKEAAAKAAAEQLLIPIPTRTSMERQKYCRWQRRSVAVQQQARGPR